MHSEVKIKFIDIKQKALETIKQIVDHNTLLVYPYFNI